MFWKKKPSIDLSLESRHQDHRSAYRIACDEDEPVIVSIDGKSHRAVNISGSGIAFRAPGFGAGQRMRAMIRLSSQERVFPVVLEVVATQRDLCRCRFQEIHEDAENLLHSYILDLQKAKIRQNQRHR